MLKIMNHKFNKAISLFIMHLLLGANVRIAQSSTSTFYKAVKPILDYETETKQFI